MEQNNYSDSQFLKDSLVYTEVQDESVTVVADGAYSGKENHDLAAGKNVQQFHPYCEENIMLTGCLNGV